ncbi:hypothetical protein [Sphingomonas phyllosphaerae]|uniref:hypothetical protein n=1 Tax=Sphingomonas phyllosphaerae TaxID=257003 RepID=UPI002FF6FB3F
MPKPWTLWECCTCHKRHADYDAAAKCETNHIADNAMNGFKERLDVIFSNRGAVEKGEAK